MRSWSDGAGVILQADWSKPGQRSHNFELSCMHDDRNFIDRMLLMHTIEFSVLCRVATSPVFAGTSRFSACLSRVPVEGLPGCYMSRFLSISTRPIAVALF